jgi:hypothetical protein
MAPSWSRASIRHRGAETPVLSIKSRCRLQTSIISRASATVVPAASLNHIDARFRSRNDGIMVEGWARRSSGPGPPWQTSSGSLRVEGCSISGRWPPGCRWLPPLQPGVRVAAEGLAMEISRKFGPRPNSNCVINSSDLKLKSCQSATVIQGLLSRASLCPQLASPGPCKSERRLSERCQPHESLCQREECGRENFLAESVVRQRAESAHGIRWWRGARLRARSAGAHEMSTAARRTHLVVAGMFNSGPLLTGC